MKALLSSGPAPWVGRVVEVSPAGHLHPHPLERTLPRTTTHYQLGQWTPTGETVDAIVPFAQRHGPPMDKHVKAHVYAFTGVREVPLELDRCPRVEEVPADLEDAQLSLSV